MHDPVAQIIDAIERKKTERAHGALVNPQKEGDVAFNYGLACGRVQGLDEALVLIRDVLSNTTEDGDHGRRRRDR